MPPVVHSEIARPPVPYRGRKEGHAILLSTLHLEDVSEGMHCPYVARVLVEGRSGASLGLTVVGVLLEAERVDPLKVSPARLVGRPGAQDSGGDIAEVQPAAEEEVEILGDLKREHVPGIENEGPLKRPGCFRPV